MKKLLILLSVLLITVQFCSCDSNDSVGGEVTIDADFRQIDDSYNTILSFMKNPTDYNGKTIAINAESSVVYNFSKNRIEKHVMLGIDPTGCCNATYEIRTNDGIYPQNGVTAEFIGSFESDGYISISSYKYDSPSQASFELDALSLGSAELVDLITEYGNDMEQSEHFGKTIRIFGHCVCSGNYKYLIGLDKNGRQTWAIEIYEPTGKLSFPSVSGNVVNPVEITGKFSVYLENGIPYACIEAKQVNRVECVFE